MATFTFYTHDTRYLAPTIAVVLVADESRALEFALQRQAESQYHTRVDVYDGQGVLVGGTARDQSADAQGPTLETPVQHGSFADGSAWPASIRWLAAAWRTLRRLPAAFKVGSHQPSH